jgi:hypothetical protein
VKSSKIWKHSMRVNLRKLYSTDGTWLICSFMVSASIAKGLIHAPTDDPAPHCG